MESTIVSSFSFTDLSFEPDIEIGLFSLFDSSYQIQLESVALSFDGTSAVDGGALIKVARASALITSVSPVFPEASRLGITDLDTVGTWDILNYADPADLETLESFYLTPNAGQTLRRWSRGNSPGIVAGQYLVVSVTAKNYVNISGSVSWRMGI